MIALLFLIFWILLVIGAWKLTRYLVYRTGRRPAVFARPWLRRTTFTLVLLIPFYGAIVDSLTFELACQLWGREIINEPRQADGFEGIYVGRWKLIADGVFQFADVPTGEAQNRRYFLADADDSACESFQAMLQESDKQLPKGVVIPKDKCMAVKEVPVGSARYVMTSESRRILKKNWFGHRLYKYELTIYDREEGRAVGLYRQLIAFRDSFFANFFGDDPGRHTCGENLVKRDGILRTLAPQTQKGHQ